MGDDRRSDSLYTGRIIPLYLLRMLEVIDLTTSFCCGGKKMIGRLERLKELITLVLKEIGEPVAKTKLWKLLYFSEADFCALRGQPITGVTYYKNHFGPTPAGNVVTKAINELSKFIKVEEGKTGTYYKFRKLYHSSLLSKDQVKSVKKTVEKYGKLSVSEIVNLSHCDEPYLAADFQGPVDLSLVRYREEGEVEEKPQESPARETISDEAARNLLKYVCQGL